MAERVYIEHLQILKTGGILRTSVTTLTFSPESLGVASKFRGALFYCRLEMARELRILQKENMRLIKLVVDQDLDNAIFKEAAKENW